MDPWLFIVEVLEASVTAEPNALSQEIKSEVAKVRELYREYLRQDYNWHQAKRLARAAWLKGWLGKQSSSA